MIPVKVNYALAWIAIGLGIFDLCLGWYALTVIWCVAGGLHLWIAHLKEKYADPRD